MRRKPKSGDRKGAVGLRLEFSLIRQVDAVAAQQKRNRSNMLAVMVEHYLKCGPVATLQRISK